MLTPHVLTADEGEALWFFGSLLLFKVTAEQSGGRFCLVEQQAARGMATPLHRQSSAEETFTILEGELRFFLGEDDPISALPGTTVFVPPGTAHAFDVRSETARWLDLTTPLHETFFRAVGDPTTTRTLPPDAPPDIARVIAAGQQVGLEVLGPPPGQRLSLG